MAEPEIVANRQSLMAPCGRSRMTAGSSGSSTMTGIACTACFSFPKDEPDLPLIDRVDPHFLSTWKDDWSVLTHPARWPFTSPRLRNNTPVIASYTEVKQWAVYRPSSVASPPS